MSQTHAFLLEFGIHHGKGHAAMRRIPTLLEDSENTLPELICHHIQQLYQHYQYLNQRILKLDDQIKAHIQTDNRCERLQSIPGIGMHTASRLVCEIGNAARFKQGRDLAAWMGLVPKQYSTGGKTKLLGISKRGNKALRTLFVHCARSLIPQRLKHQHTSIGQWVGRLVDRKPFNVATVALANKLVRIAWAVLVKEKPFSFSM